MLCKIFALCIILFVKIVISDGTLVIYFWQGREEQSYPEMDKDWYINIFSCPFSCQQMRHIFLISKLKLLKRYANNSSGAVVTQINSSVLSVFLTIRYVSKTYG